jgi:hypothetical protein
MGISIFHPSNQQQQPSKTLLPNIKSQLPAAASPPGTAAFQ